LDYKEFFVNLEFIKLRVIFDEEKRKILKTEIFDKTSINSFEKENYISEMIKKYFYGDLEKFDLSFLYMDNLGSLQKRVLNKLVEIPRGKVTTYKRLSELIGKDRAYRAIGTTLAKNPFPILIPCHRVIKSDLNVGNFGDRPDLKIKILQFEGVIFEKEHFVSKEFVL